MKVSIIVPALNAASYLTVALESALSQTHQDVEVIVVDDGSSDDTFSVAGAMQKADDRIVILRHPVTRGVSAARNTAIRHASGEWLAILDSDDQFHPDRIKDLLTIAQLRQLDIIADNLSLVDFGSKALLGLAFHREWVSDEELVTLPYLLKRDWPGAHGCFSFGTMKPLIRTSVVRQAHLHYDESLSLGEDLLFYADLILSGAKFGLTDRAYYYYSVRDMSLSSRKRPTSEMIEANNLIASRVNSSALEHRKKADLRDLLEHRGRALWFQFFTWNLRTRSFGQAANAGRHLPPGFLVAELGGRIMRRFGLRARSGWAV